ncbi:uncharacterized protein LOC126841255 isoform X2 [Adelges cooleyi]|uniref:uncharacterized protein LOC126841255 isoform X2 n=1 Tax=Adelges cooleyi TaxID=133065 RepID=UPI00217F67B7|nr:uncharacterized protein LOC126841255 isoform X2 [Adelges cooleyi]
MASTSEAIAEDIFDEEVNNTFVPVFAPVEYQEDYRMEVLITNTFIENAFRAGRLEQIITELVDDNVHFKDFVIINSMIAAPDDRDLLLFVDSEETVIPSDDNMTNLKHYQYNMGLKIKNALGLGDPAIDETQSLALETLGHKRRECTGPAIKNTIQHILDELVYNLPDTDDFLIRMCRLTGIYLSATFPESFINRLRINYEDRDCILYHGPWQNKIYRIHNGDWTQILPGGIMRPLFLN